ncbi:MAG: RsmB/NOP family class I SAM-dependent RNA methyltransferase [Paracoccaceae bacterium]
MTPAARLSAAIEVLDRILAGAPAEQALTGWGRANRFAGSGDRYALRDLVFEALRCRRSFAALGGSESGRGLILGSLRAAGTEPATMFTGVAHAPTPVQSDEVGRDPELLEALDCTEWLAPRLQSSLGEDFAPVMMTLRQRAPVFLRVNARNATRDVAMRSLSDEGITTRNCDWVNTALEVTGNARKIQTSAAYVTGVVELQDASSQAVVAALDLQDGTRVLDYCAGGGGKTLAMAAFGVIPDAHDANPSRMRDLPARAARAGAKVSLIKNPTVSEPYDLILADVPCSGSGSWRRDPQGKWALTEAKLNDLIKLQAQILDSVLAFVKPGGVLAYATCSLLADENEAQVADFIARHPDWRLMDQRRFSPLHGGDGFFLARLTQV